jgi:hypothetical protein
MFMSDTTTTEGLRKDAELVTLRTENLRLREALEEIRPYVVDAATSVQHAVVSVIDRVLFSTPVTQREVERVRAMERVVEIFDNVHDHSATLKPETAYLLTDKRYVFVPEEEFVKLEEAADDYDQVVKG